MTHCTPAEPRGSRHPVRISSFGPAAVFHCRALPGHRIFDWLEVSGYGGHRQDAFYLGLEFFEQIMTMLNCPIARDQDVEGNKLTGTGLPGAQIMESNAPLGLSIKNLCDLDLV